MRGAETMAWSRHQQVARGYLGNAPPPRIRRDLRIVKNPTVETCYKHTHKHGRGSYLSDGIRGDSQSPIEAEPLRSKDRGLFTYNIEIYVLAGTRCIWLRDRARCQVQSCQVEHVKFLES